ncbi:phosphatase PAP2 family protein [Chitinimonas sp. BJB300]|uniref:phosphatase PAP2 family protein n=1 Tax=Chitinimonas sp. BJB300 TaxID=1559339 RepID=UPI000C0D3BA9|nr:phosphatase PAP2 family protein [Chitinimonas sp. BJB300]PHV12369.1 phosphatase PAP2 family protein [Chitinimonas sp. BJB300]TSJ91078.1 phosphatase PAP2 family protein [Chitinimonas sp. BJB300]
MRLPLNREDWLALDQHWTACCNRASRYHFWRGFFVCISRVGNGIFWYVLMAGLLLVNGLSALPVVMHMVGVGLAGLILYKWLKRITSRPRPFMRSEAILRAYDVLDEYSFPSGHTLHAVSLSIVALAYLPVLAGLLIPFTVLVAVSRPVLGLHYPSDVVAGAMIGASLAALSLALV